MRLVSRPLFSFALLALTLAFVPARADEQEAAPTYRAEKASSVDQALSEYAAPREGKKPTYRVRTYRVAVKKLYARKAIPQR
jgi:hypothetical protein